MNIITAKESHYEEVRKFYHSLIDNMKDSDFEIGWKKDIYPSPQFLQESIAGGELYIGLERDTIASAMVLNHKCNEEYKKFNWQTKASENEITVIHALGVHPLYSKKGYGKRMVKKAIEIALNNNQKFIRLDVLGGNVPAEKLYVSFGFKYMDTLKMYYEDTGWTDYKLYEYIL